MIILGIKERPLKDHKLFPVIYEHISNLEVGECLYIEREIQYILEGIAKVQGDIRGGLSYRNQRFHYLVETVDHPIRKKDLGSAPPKVLKITKLK